MAAFYGVVRGARGKVTRCGTPASGLSTEAASWQGCIRVEVYVRGKGPDMCRVTMIPWEGKGTLKLLYAGPIGTYAPIKCG